MKQIISPQFNSEIHSLIQRTDELIIMMRRFFILINKIVNASPLGFDIKSVNILKRFNDIKKLCSIRDALSSFTFRDKLKGNNLSLCYGFVNIIHSILAF